MCGDRFVDFDADLSDVRRAPRSVGSSPTLGTWKGVRLVKVTQSNICETLNKSHAFSCASCRAVSSQTRNRLHNTPGSVAIDEPVLTHGSFQTAPRTHT